MIADTAVSASEMTRPTCAVELMCVRRLQRCLLPSVLGKVEASTHPTIRAAFRLRCRTARKPRKSKSCLISTECKRWQGRCRKLSLCCLYAFCALVHFYDRNGQRHRYAKVFSAAVMCTISTATVFSLETKSVLTAYFFGSLMSCRQRVYSNLAADRTMTRWKL